MHSAMIEDWELGVLYRKEGERLGDEAAAVASVRRKFFEQLCGSSKNTRFFMGTVFPVQHLGCAGRILAPQGGPTSFVCGEPDGFLLVLRRCEAQSAQGGASITDKRRDRRPRVRLSIVSLGRLLWRPL
jgi:hypothetical protein